MGLERYLAAFDPYMGVKLVKLISTTAYSAYESPGQWCETALNLADRSIAEQVGTVSGLGASS